MMPPFLSHCLCLLRARVDNAFVQTTPLSKQCEVLSQQFFGTLLLFALGGGGGKAVPLTKRVLRRKHINAGEMALCIKAGTRARSDMPSQRLHVAV